MNIQDRRRLLGPASAKPIQFDRSEDVKYTTTIDANLKNNEISKFSIETGLITNANGSSYLEKEEKTIIQTSVSGPRPIRGSFIDQLALSIECKFAPFLQQPNNLINKLDSNIPTNFNGKFNLTKIEHRISSFVESCLLSSIVLENYPKSSIEIFVKILNTSSNTSLLSLTKDIIHSVNLALVDAQIELKDMITCGNLLYKNGETFIDPLFTSEDGGLELLLAFMNYKDEIVGIWFEGNDVIDDDNTEELVEKCKEMSILVRSNLNSFLFEKFDH